MESVIDKLSEIETAASRIMESAVEETDVRTTRPRNVPLLMITIRMLRLPEHWKLPKRTLQEQADRELEHLKTSTERSLKHMDAYYKEHKDALCDKIYHKIIRM